METYLKVLGLNPGATRAEIKQAYRDLVKVWHPDRFGSDKRLKEKAEERLKEINHAYDQLEAGYSDKLIFEGTFLDEKGEEKAWRFETESEQELLENLNSHGWRILKKHKLWGVSFVQHQAEMAKADAEWESPLKAGLLSALLYGGAIIAVGLIIMILPYVLVLASVAIVAFIAWKIIEGTKKKQQAGSESFRYEGGASMKTNSTIYTSDKKPDTKRCPICDGEIGIGVIRCVHCGKGFVGEPSPSDKSYRPVELNLIKTSIEQLCSGGMDRSQATEMVNLAVDAAIDASKAEKSYGMGQMGEKFLQLMRDNEEARKKFLYDEIIKEGVKEEDLLWWWNLDDVERQMELQLDNMFRLSAALHWESEGKTSEEVGHLIRKTYAMYGDITDQSHGKGDDRPLPYALHERIDKWLMAKGMDLVGMKTEIENSSSMNAFIRKQIRAGKI